MADRYVTDDGKTLYKDGRFNWWAIANQDQLWIDRDGKAHSIPLMDPAYRLNCARFFVRNHAPNLKRGLELEYVHMSWPDPDSMAFDHVDAEFDELLRTSVIEWADRLPLIQALVPGRPQ